MLIGESLSAPTTAPVLLQEAEPDFQAVVPSAELPRLSTAYMDVEPEDRLTVMRDAWVGREVVELFCDVRDQEGHKHPGSVKDGMGLAYAALLPGYDYKQVGQLIAKERARGVDPCETLGRYFDMSHTSAPVRHALPGESIGDYIDYVSREALLLPARPKDTGRDLRTLGPIDVPGTRFRSDFGAHDSAVVALGKVRRGDLAGAIQTIDNGMFQTMRWGAPPNIDILDSLDRTQTPHVSFAIEAIAASYGDRKDEVLAHYAPGLLRLSQFWLGDISALNAARIPLGRGGAVGRHAVLPWQHPNGDREREFRNYSDARIDPETLEGIRLEGAKEDKDRMSRILHGLTGEARVRRWKQLQRDILAACESTKDFQPSSQSIDGLTLDTLRTTQIAPIMLQAMLVHLFRTTAAALRAAGRHEEAAYIQGEELQLAAVINRRHWRDVSETEGYYTDTVIRDGSQTGAVDGTSCYPLLVGGIVPHDRRFKQANFFRNHMARQYGYLISLATTGEQWDGDPDKEETGEKGENRGWPSVNMWDTEAFLMGAMEDEMEGQDSEATLAASEVGTRIIPGMGAKFAVTGTVTEKLNVVDPIAFVNGGEYGRDEEAKKEELTGEQIGFGLSDGAHRDLDGRDLPYEAKHPHETWRRLTVEHLERLGSMGLRTPGL